MNRFSPKQILSNIATAVRETVDSVNGTFIARDAAIRGALFLMIALPGLSFGNPGAAPAPGAVAAPGAVNNGFRVWTPEQEEENEQKKAARKEAEYKKFVEVCGGEKRNSSECADYMAFNRITAPAVGQCEKLSSSFDKINDRARESCQQVGIGDYGKCVEKVSYCEEADAKVAEYNEETEGAEYCSKILANSCPSLPSFNIGADYKADKQDAERDRKAAKRDLDELMEDDRKNKKDLATQQRELREQQENAALEFRRKQDSLMEKMQQMLEGISASQQKAFDDAQAAATQMEVEYVKMRADARAAADMVAQAEDDLRLMCRQSAEKQYQEAEKVRAASEKKGRKNRGTSVSGASKRSKMAIAQQQQIDFQKFYTQCESGSSADGVGGKNRIATAKRAKDTADKMMAEKSAMIEKQRTQMMAKLQQMEEDSTNQKSKAVDEIQKQFTQMNEEKALVDQQNAARIAEMANNNRMAEASMQTRIQAANQELMQTQQEAALAVNRLSCAGRNAQKSSTVLAEKDKGFASARSNVEDLKSACKAFESRPLCGEAPSACAGFKTWGAKNRNSRPAYEIRESRQ